MDEHGFTGGYTIIKDYMRERERRGREMFVPLSHPPGHAQADFGEAVVIIGGVEQKAHFFVLDLPHSDACFVRAYRRRRPRPGLTAMSMPSPSSARCRCRCSMTTTGASCRRSCLTGHGCGQALQRVPVALRVARLLRPTWQGQRQGQRGGFGWLLAAQLHGADPALCAWDEFNAHLEAQCRKRQSDLLRGQTETIGERLARDLAAMSELPAAPFEAWEQATGRVGSQALVRYKTNDYSVPAAYGHRDVWIRGYVDAVVIGCGGEIIARHPRCYGREDAVFDPLHYLPLIERKINALDQAAPLAEWDLPPELATLRRLMEARMLKMGRRGYVQVLRLLETFGLKDLHAAVKRSLQQGAVGFDAVKHLVLCQVEKRPPRLDLDGYPYPPRANVATTQAASYMTLLSEAAQ